MSGFDDNDTKTDGHKDEDVLKTFDMYHFFSRKDVIAIALLVFILLVFAIFSALSVPQVS